MVLIWMDEKISEYSLNEIEIGFKKENEHWIYDLKDSIRSPSHLLLEVE